MKNEPEQEEQTNEEATNEELVDFTQEFLDSLP